MMIAIDPSTQSERDNYKLLIGSIIPAADRIRHDACRRRRVERSALQLFHDRDGGSADGLHLRAAKERRPKDTARNAIDTGAFVVHISDESYIDQINQTAAALPPRKAK